MKKQWAWIMKTSVFLAFVIMLLGCASTGNYSEEIPADLIPGPGQSLVTVQRSNSGLGGAIKMQIWIDDEEVAGSIKRGVRTFIAVSNGEYTIQAGSTRVDMGNQITFSVQDEEVAFLAEPAMGLIAARFNLSEMYRKNF